jgi:glycosyltransferase involved in cell wall biosynthesis/SAM-dependent methyltransferase
MASMKTAACDVESNGTKPEGMDGVALPTYILITPARNEAAFIEKTIESVIHQTVLPLKWVIVDDASTDDTAQIVSKYLPSYPWMELVRRQRSEKRNFAQKVHSFNCGLARVQDLGWEMVANLDADISFGPDHFEFLLRQCVADPQLGVVGTAFCEEGYSLEGDAFCDWAWHVGGQCQLFRKQCFEEIGGYLPAPAGGVDWIAVITARMKGWKTRSFAERQFFHYRPLGTAGRGRVAAAFAYGKKDYSVGSHPLWEFLRAVRHLGRKPYLLSGGALGLGYLLGWVRHAPRAVSQEFVRFHRNEQMEKLKGLLKRRLLALRPTRDATEHDAFRYRRESYIPECLDGVKFAGNRVLEIGLGQGTESEQIIRRGGRWSGLDLTQASATRVRERLRLRNLPYDDLRVGSVLQIPYPDNSFDMVFTHGVLHHVPEILQAQAEIARVLRPGGELVMVVYAKWSLNYMLSISFLRRIGLAARVWLGLPGKGISAAHVKNAREEGLFPYLRMERFIHRSTDGPDNPYTKVYGMREVRDDFPGFSVTRAYKRFMHAPPLPVKWLPLQRMLGWHLWVHLTVRKNGAAQGESPTTPARQRVEDPAAMRVQPAALHRVGSDLVCAEDDRQPAR